ncbi:MAG: exodeoxyribonuclease VII large subunit [Candidatus Methylomirabilia bacterium]
MREPTFAEAGRRVWSVSELTARIKELLEERFLGLWVEGEISNLRIPSSGHAYFTLKDEAAQLRAVLFRNRGRRLRFALEDGLQVMAFGSLEVYAARGEYQLVVELLEPKGLGALQLAFEQLKARLLAEGLFDEARKRSLPRVPRKIGIVTSPTGAALRDILKILSRRFADLHILIAPVRVQGEEAPGEIVQALHDLNLVEDLDALIVARGGGSLEDLWAFNDEAVARAIAAAKVPVISAVGHETDVTIADFVADLRAPTPSGAAELVVEEKARVIAELGALTTRLTRALRQRLDRHRSMVELLARRRVLTDPARPIRDLQRRLDDLTLRLGSGLNATRARRRQRFLLAASALRSRTPLAFVAASTRQLAELDRRLHAGMAHAVERTRHRLTTAAGQLDSLSPLSVLRRGYSVARLPSGEIVRSGRQVEPGQTVDVLLHEGRLDCRVEAIREGHD